jgi:hypothetical protein
MSTTKPEYIFSSIMFCNTNQASLYSLTSEPSVSRIESLETSSPALKYEHTDSTANSSIPTIPSIQRRSDGDIVKSGSAITATTATYNGRNGPLYMKCVVKKLVDRHKLIATLCADEQFRRTMASERNIRRSNTSSSSSTTVYGRRKRKSSES